MEGRARNSECHSVADLIEQLRSGHSTLTQAPSAPSSPQLTDVHVADLCACRARENQLGLAIAISVTSGEQRQIESIARFRS
jgi:hypothetical protein